MTEWQTIDTAPKDGTLIDLWCVPPVMGEFSVRGVRLTDCAWHEADDIFPFTGWTRMQDDGHRDLVEGKPTNQNGLPPWQPTHWMPLPEPPKEQSDD